MAGVICLHLILVLCVLLHCNCLRVLFKSLRSSCSSTWRTQTGRCDSLRHYTCAVCYPQLLYSITLRVLCVPCVPMCKHCTPEQVEGTCGTLHCSA